MTKYSKQCVHKAISKYHHLYNTSPKKNNRIVFKILNTPPLNSLMDCHYNSLIHPDDIATEIHIQQSINNRPRS
jgi:hypothetical protein